MDNFSKDYNKDKTNIEYINLDIYKDFGILYPDVDVVFIDIIDNNNLINYTYNY